MTSGGRENTMCNNKPNLGCHDARKRNGGRATKDNKKKEKKTIRGKAREADPPKISGDLFSNTALSYLRDAP